MLKLTKIAYLYRSLWTKQKWREIRTTVARIKNSDKYLTAMRFEIRAVPHFPHLPHLYVSSLCWFKDAIRIKCVIYINGNNTEFTQWLRISWEQASFRVQYNTYYNNKQLQKVNTTSTFVVVKILTKVYMYYYYWYSALGPVWAETRARDWYGSDTLHPGQVLTGSLPLLSPAF
jgi:hypothetical protein